MLVERTQRAVQPRKEVAATRIGSRFERNEIRSQRHPPLPLHIMKSPDHLRWRRGDSLDTDDESLGHLWTEDRIRVTDGLLKRGNKPTIVDRRNDGEAHLRNHTHQRRIAQGDLLGCCRDEWVLVNT